MDMIEMSRCALIFEPLNFDEQTRASQINPVTPSGIYRLMLPREDYKHTGLYSQSLRRDQQVDNRHFAFVYTDGKKGRAP